MLNKFLSFYRLVCPSFTEVVNFFVTFVVGEKLVVHVVLIASQNDGKLVSVVLRNDLEKFKINIP
jgi:hypothetical protein